MPYLMSASAVSSSCSLEAADEQLWEIKKLRREDLKSFEQKENKIEYKINLKLQDTLDEAQFYLGTNVIEKASLTDGMKMFTVWLEDR